MKFNRKERYDFFDLVKIMEILRSDSGCPWDKEQTHESIKHNFLEEVYEAIDAIDQKDDENLKEELGDVLLQVVFHTEIARREGRFEIGDVTSGIVEKLIRRHPHIFSDVIADTPAEVLRNWDDIKRGEKGVSSHTEAMEGIPRSMPSLLRAGKIQQKAKKAGMDFESAADVLAKLREETNELSEEIAREDRERCEEELGDVLFTIVNLARFLKLDPEISLNKSCDKFIKRFSYVENSIKASYNKQLEDLGPEELDKIWEKSKNIDRKV